EATDAGPDGLSIELHNRTVRNVPIRYLRATIDGIDKKLRESIAQGSVTFDELSNVRSVDIEADIDANDARSFISGELARQSEAHRALTGLQITFGAGSVTVAGMVDFSKIPGNPLSFINLGPAPFRADATVRMEGDRLVIGISNATLNNVPFVPPLSTQLLEWLNPLMDFSALSHEAGLTKIDISPSGISLRGFLFSR
ncbi:MAG TPA: LmeA family phospholipid-binding protein, partial [Candidatus Ozemobacteraceae bacterium]|nr:LmeA family phospholipid-binding protein [Candidatus Ozemobacteraceae bacterium]